jgi:hypothetical protein
MTSKAMDLPVIGSEWTHLTAPGVFVVTDGTLNGLVIWTEKGQSKEYYGPLNEFLSVFQPATPYTEQETTNDRS